MGILAQKGEGRGGRGGDDHEERQAAAAEAASPAHRGAEEGAAGDVADDGKRGDRHTRGRLSPARGLLLLEALLEDETLDVDALAPLHLLPGADHLELLALGDHPETR